MSTPGARRSPSPTTGWRGATRPPCALIGNWARRRRWVCASPTSLARSAQDPLAELTYAFTSLGLKNGTGLGLAGEELVALPLHPLQSFVRPKELLQAFERTLVDQVCRSGVDVNRSLQYDHHFGKLQFVAGLGPRKAQAFRRAASREPGADDREGGGYGIVTSRRKMGALRHEEPQRKRGVNLPVFRMRRFLRVRATWTLARFSYQSVR